MSSRNFIIEKLVATGWVFMLVGVLYKVKAVFMEIKYPGLNMKKNNNAEVISEFENTFQI